MVFWNIECDEVVPGVFNFRAFDDSKAQATHDLFEMFDRLSDWMLTT